MTTLTKQPNQKRPRRSSSLPPGPGAGFGAQHARRNSLPSRPLTEASREGRLAGISVRRADTNARGTPAIPRLALPEPLSRQSRSLSHGGDIDRFVEHRRSLRQLRRLYDEGALSDDPAEASAWLIERFGATSGSDAAKVAKMPPQSGQLRRRAPAGEPFSRADGVHELVADLSEGERRLFHYVRVVEAYWLRLREDLDAFEALTGRMLREGKSAEAIVSAPEIKRFVRILAVEQTQLRADVQRVQHVAGRYGQALMQLRPREVSAELVDALARAVRFAADIDRRTSRELVWNAMSVHLRVGRLDDKVKRAQRTQLRDLLARQLAPLRRGALAPRSKKASAHVIDDTTLERLVLLALGASSQLHVDVQHPLLANRKLEVRSAEMMSLLEDKFTRRHSTLSELLAETLQPTQVQLALLSAKLRDAKLLRV